MYRVRIVAVILACKSGLLLSSACGVAGENQGSRTAGQEHLRLSVVFLI